MQLQSHTTRVHPAHPARVAKPIPRRLLGVRHASGKGNGSIDSVDYPDPEAKYRTYGNFFGGVFKLDADWLQDVPRVRVRNSESRKMEELLELAVLTGKLEPWEARSKLEYLRKRRKNWERIYNYVTKQEVTATLEVIEEANRKVEEALSEEARERNSVNSLKEQLQNLQKEVDAARERLQMTQSRVDQNLKRVNELRAEAVALERMRAATVLEPSTSTSTADAPAASSAPSTSYSPQLELPRVRSSPRSRRGKGLQSSMEMEEALRNFWYPAEFSSKLTKDTMVPFEIFGEPWVLFRDEKGQPSCIKDQCAHRACPLSLGKVVEGRVECPYHGWQFNGDGACTKMPSTAFCRNVGVAALPCAERDGFIWVWPGEGMPDEVPNWTLPPAGFEVHAEIMVDVPVEHGLLMENLLDLAHAPFTHTSTFARGWPVPDFVKFHATKLLSGNWDPYPIDMGFHPPCMVTSMIGLAQPGKIMRGVTADQCENHLHQLHVCMPSKKGHTRLLYRMSLDFMGWLRHVPYIDRVWKGVAGQVLGEDLVLVLGQQDRLQRGGDTWSHPVSYDKIAVRYRRWRNTVAEGDVEGSRELARSASMSAGQMFSIEEDDLPGEQAERTN